MGRITATQATREQCIQSFEFYLCLVSLLMFGFDEILLSFAHVWGLLQTRPYQKM